MRGSTNSQPLVRTDYTPLYFTKIKEGAGYAVYQLGKLVFVVLQYVGAMTITDLPISLGYYKTVLNGTASINVGQATIYGTTVTVTNTSGISENMLGTLIYLSQ